MEQTAQEALRKAKEAERDCQRGEVVRQCDIALEALKKLPDDATHRRLRAEVLLLKGNAIGDLDRDVALKCYEEVLAIKKETGSKAEYASFLAFMGHQYSFAGRRPKASPASGQGARRFPIRYGSTGDSERSMAAYEEALKLFEELGDKGELAAIVTRRGCEALCGNPPMAMHFFERAMPFFAESGTHKMMAGICRAGIKLLGEVAKKTPSRLMVRDLLYYGITCDRFRRGAAGVVCMGGDGFLGGGIGGKPWNINPPGASLDFMKKAGDTWSRNVCSYTYHPLRATITFESDSETVEVPAGKFSHCWKIKSVTVQTSTEAGDENERRERNKGNCGTRERWYAPGVGLVRYRAEHEDGLKATVELAAYSIQEDKESHFPLAVGNWWEYKLVQPFTPPFVEQSRITEIETGPDGAKQVRSFSSRDPHEFFDKDRYEIFDREENTFYISHYQYAYRCFGEHTKPPKRGTGRPG